LKKTQDDINDLKIALTLHYPNLKYNILLLHDPNGKEYYIKHLVYMRYTMDDDELKRLNYL